MAKLTAATATQEPELIDEDETPDPDQIDPTDEPEGGVEDEQDDEDIDGADALGDAGKKALDRMKADRNEARRQKREADAELQRLRDALAAKDRSPEENELEQAKASARAEALREANEKILRLRVVAAASGRLKNPDDALKLIDLSAFEVDEDGNVDSEDLQEAIADLLDERPYIAAQSSASSFESTRGKRGPKKLTKDDLASGKYTAEQIAKAYDEGRVQL